MNIEAKGRVLIVSGISGSGKTMLCEFAAALAQARGWHTAGILTPGRWCNGQKTLIDMQDLRSGQRGILADLNTEPQQSGGRRWHLRHESVNWGTAILNHATPCDLLVIDELGPLELIDGGGWRNGLDVLRSGSYQLALAVVRPTLLPVIYELLPDLDLLTLMVSQGSQLVCRQQLAAEMQKAEDRHD
jgi:nucleoside-triphosphatase THEP1